MEDNPPNPINSINNGHSPLPTSSTPSTNISAQHYLAEIKYPNIPEVITLDKIFNVLQKIRTTSKPLFYKWLPLNRPKNGEIFLEQKYPLTSDPVSGDQFSIFDDGYLWSSIPKPEIQEFQGHLIEIFKWNEGYLPGDKFFTMSKTEFRLKTPNNILFLIHYMEIKEPNVPVRTALPATKISPMYLQQQFFQQLKQQMAQITAMKRSPSPSLTSQVRAPPQTNQAQAQMMNRVPSSAMTSKPPTNRPPINTTNAMRPSQQPVNPTSTPAIDPSSTIESSLDIFDSFSDFEAAYYRLNTIKPFLSRLLESTATTVQSTPADSLPEGLEADLIAATRKKISSIQERSEIFKKSHQDSLQQFKTTQKSFWDTLAQLEKSSDPDRIYNQFLQGQDSLMDQDSAEVSVSYKSL